MTQHHWAAMHEMDDSRWMKQQLKRQVFSRLRKTASCVTKSVICHNKLAKTV